MSPVLAGVAAAALFSSTFVLNAMVGTHGGHWFWAAALRYLWTLMMLLGYVAIRYGRGGMIDALRIAVRDRHLLAAATIPGVLLFYAPLCYAGANAPAWIIACTWQSTILFSPLILTRFFGYRIPGLVFSWAALALAGVVLANATSSVVESADYGEWLVGFLCVAVAAFAYPVGNQILHECLAGRRYGVNWSGTIAADSAVRVLLVSAFSLPGWLLLGIVVQPPAPLPEDCWRSFAVAVLSGVLATSIFYAARSRAGSPSMVAAVDATQVMEVLFAMAGDVLILGNRLPGALASAGVVLTCVGVVGTARAAHRA